MTKLAYRSTFSKLALWVAGSSLAVACGGFSSVNPGMTGAEVSKQMSMYPTTRIEPFEGGYSATYYANDSCVLFKDDRVVGKEEATQERQAIGLGGIAMSATTVCHALCVPPGYSRQRSCESSGQVQGPRMR